MAQRFQRELPVSIVRVEHLSHQYGTKTVLSDISFDLKPGSVTALVGHNGSGKSTLLRILAGILAPSEGSVSIFSKSFATSAVSIKRRLGILLDSNPLYPDLSVRDSLQWMGRLRGMSKSEITRAIERVVTICALESVHHQRVGVLSKGFRQRLGFAQTVLHDPDLLLLDEPFSGMDQVSRASLLQMLHSYPQKKCVLLASHVGSEVLPVASEFLYLTQGQISQFSSLAKLEKRWRLA